MEQNNSGYNTGGGKYKYIDIVCATCGATVKKRKDFVLNVQKENRKVVCSRTCAVPHRKPNTYKPIALDEYVGKNKTSICKLCKVELPIKEFIKNADNKHKKFRKSFFCKNCRIIRKKEYRLKAQYNFKSIEEYDRMLREQKGLCAICYTKMSRPCIDHNHLTGKVRKILCIQCNAMIGNCHESIGVLYSAIQYLENS